MSGRDLTEAVWDDFFPFYEDTGSRKWGRPYLNRAFFSRRGSDGRARRADDGEARRALYSGRDQFPRRQHALRTQLGLHRGSPFLHFELCYHQAIDYAIAHGLSRVEAGAQGEHKLARGYRPVITRSLHHIADPGLRRPVAAYLAQERERIAEAQVALEAEGPFRKGNDGDA